MDPKSFERLGYAHLPGALGSREVRLLTAALRELERRPPDALPPACRRSHAPALGETRLLDVVACGPPFDGLVEHPAILPHVKRVVRGPLRLTRAHGILRGAGTGLPLHRIEPARFRRDRAGPHSDHVTVAVWLTDVGPDDGPMVVLEGSHRGAGELPFARFHPAWDLPSNDLDYLLDYLNARWTHPAVPWERIPGYREIHARAGDVLLFAESLWHGAREVRQGRGRRSLVLTFAAGSSAAGRRGGRLDALAERLAPGRGRPFPRSTATTVRTWTVGPALGAVPGEDDVTRVNIGLVRALVRTRCGDPRPAELVGLDGTMHLLAGGEACWTLVVVDGRLAIRSGLAGEADVVVRCAIEDLVGLIERRVAPEELLRPGGCLVDGEVELAWRLIATLFPAPAGGRDAP